jgi:D-lactate dehydrogenase (cytochrome)
MSYRIQARRARQVPSKGRVLTDDDVQTYLKDAANTPGGTSPAVFVPKNEGELVHAVGECEKILVIGAQSSLTGGATPMGESIISTSALDSLGPIEENSIRVGAGLPLITLQQSLKSQGYFYPPVPTFDGAFVGGVVATNAAGAQTFKYGVTRDWVQALTVVLDDGSILDIKRGQVKAKDGAFEVLDMKGQSRRLPVPQYTMPKVAKCSAGYYATPEMDLIDLFIGSEGTLGLISEVVLRVSPIHFKVMSAFVTVSDESLGIALAGRLRDASLKSREGSGSGLDISAIESLDRRSLELLREEGEHRRLGISLPEGNDFGLFFQVECPLEWDAESVTDEMEVFFDDESSGSSPIIELCQILSDFEALEDMEIALPGDERRARQLFELRDRVPTIVNHRVADAQREIDGRIHKTAADMVVPFEHFKAMMDVYRAGFVERGLDYAVWGHISDGNVHPNVIPKSYEDVVAGKEVILKFAKTVKELGGCPLAEHGVGRNPMKQALLRGLYGDDGIVNMRGLKEALDPAYKFAPGVLFPR